MGIGKMNIPLFLSTLPEGMTMTINSIDADTPSGMYTYNQYKISLPHTFTSSDIAAGLPNNKRGAKIGEFLLQTDGAFDYGNGGSFLLKFTISGRPTAHPEMPEAHITGTLTIGTSTWGLVTRPDKTNFFWTIDGVKPLPGPDGTPTSCHGTFTADTPYLGYLEDSCITVTAIPEKGAYGLGVSNQQDLLVRILQGAVPAIMAGHLLVWGYAAGWVIASGATVVKAVVWVAEKSDKIHL